MDEEFDWQSGPINLREAYRDRNFDDEFISKIAKDVILVLSPQLLAEPHNSSCDEVVVHDRLIGPLERFVCDLDQNDPEEKVKKVFDEIQSYDQPSRLCRRILKSGDVTFSCNDCALDGTCVVCIDCFQKSAHKDHNYRMSNSDGGGCCDCGDVEAWKQNHACSDHIATNQAGVSLSNFDSKELRITQIDQDKENILDMIKRLPKKFATRYFLICQASLRYALLMLSWTDNDTLPPSLEKIYGDMKDPDLVNLLSPYKTRKNYFTVLFNDEVHTYDHVIATLVKIIKCSKMTASIMASTISREGRSLIVKDTRGNCDNYSSKINQVRDGHQGPLKVASIHGKILAHQAFALKLVEWIRKLSSMSDGLRILTAHTLLSSGDLPGDLPGYNYSETMFERIALSNTKLWKIARVEWNDLFVKTLLTDYSIKQEVARLITRNYQQLIDDFIHDDHDHSVSILTLTTQIYTVPSLTCMLVEEESALSITLGTFVNVCKAAKRENQGNSFENRHTFDMNPIRRAYYAIHDFKYLINLQPTRWTFNLRKSVLEAMNLFLGLLESLQGMDSVKRQLGQHLEYEPDWESGMTLQGKLIHLITRFVEFLSYDDEVLIESVAEVLTRLTRICRYKGYVTRELFGHTADCINYDVTTMPVSIHLPLTRFAAALIVMLMRKRPCDSIPYDETLVVIPRETEHKGKMGIIEIMEPSLRAEVMIAQFRSSMWRRNGYSLVNQIINFQSPVMRREMFDRDILVLQECAAMCDPNEFMIHLINKFNLFGWFTSDTVGDANANKSNDDEILTQTMSLGDEFLQLLLIIIGERFCVGIGHVNDEDIMKNEIIQLLCVSPMARSDLTTKLQVNDFELDCIKAVAELKRSTSTTTGKYELKEEFYDRFNPFFYHYTRRYQSNALDTQLKRKKNLGNQLVCCPPPKPVQLTKQFSNLNELLKCDILLVLIEKILTRSLNVAPDVTKNSGENSTKEPSKFGASELQLDQTLHLIGLGLWEQERDPTGYRYIDVAHSKGIFNLIRDNYEKGERNKDLLMWLMRKTDALIDLITQRAQSGELVGDSSLDICADIKRIFMSALNVIDNKNQDTKKQNSLLASQRRERIMAMMKANQEKFLSYQTTKELVAETEKHDAPKMAQGFGQEHGSSSATTSSMQANHSGGGRQRKTKPPKSIMGFASSSKINKSLNSSSRTPVVQQTSQPDSEQFVMEGIEQDLSEEMESEQPLIVQPETSHMCILCRDQQQIGFDKPTMVLLAFVQRSAVLSQNRNQRRIPNFAVIPNNLMKSQLMSRNSYTITQQRLSYTSDNSWSFDATFMPADLFFSPHISTCGHVMHYDCWRSHTDAVLKREVSRLNRSARHASFEPDKHEILCPLCDCISNATIPLLPNYTRFSNRRAQTNGNPESVFNMTPEMVNQSSSEQISAFLTALRSSVDTLKQIRHIKDVSPNKTSTYETEKCLRLFQPRPLNDVLVELDEMSALGLRNFLSTVRSNRILATSCSKTLLSSMTALSERIHLVGLDLDRCIIEWRTFLMTSWTVAYTLQSYERTSRFKGTPIFDDLQSSSKSIGLSSLLRYAFSSMMTQQSDMIQSLLIRKLRYLLMSDEYLTSSPCCLDIDAYETLVSLLIMLPRLYSHIDDLSPLPGDEQVMSDTQGSSQQSSQLSSSSRSSELHQWITQALDTEYNRNLIHLMVLFNLVQICISLQTEIGCERISMIDKDDEETNTTIGDDVIMNEDSMIDCNDERDFEAFMSFYRDCIISSGHPISELQDINGQFCRRVRARMLPFLRLCAMLMFHISLIPFPECLKTQSAFKRCPDDGNGGEFEQQVEWSYVDDEFISLCQYLNLPFKFSILLKSQEARQLARSWLRHSRVPVLIRSQLEKFGKSNDPTGNVVDSTKAAAPSQTVQLSKSCPTTRSHTSAAQQLLKQQQRQDREKDSQHSASSSELMPIRFIPQPHLAPRLIQLPYDYSELVDRVSDFTCPSIKNQDSRTPTICLVCGMILCSNSYCCQRDLNDLASDFDQLSLRRGSSGSLSGSSSGIVEHGSLTPGWLPAAVSLVTNHASGVAGSLNTFMLPNMIPNTANASEQRALATTLQNYQQLVGSCTYHAYECSGGVGIFLRIRKCQILMLSGKSKGCYQAAPYNDDHGETDYGLVRGNPLHLNREHYRKIEQAWLSHSIAEQISRSLEYSPYFSSINWYLH